MDREKKEQEINHLQEKFSKAKASFLIDFKGINVPEVTDLRKKIASSGADMRVVRNTLAKMSLKKHEQISNALGDYFVGTNALVFAYEDITNIAKILCDFESKVESLKLKVGFMDGEKLSSEKIIYLSKLPSKDELRARFLSVLQAVPSKFLRQLNAPLEGFVRILRAKENLN